MKDLFELLKENSETGLYPFHMPGHKRRQDLFSGLFRGLPFDIDITEIDGFDNLHNPEGIIKAEQENAARIYGSKATYFLVNGSTSGILTAVSACCERGDKIIVARNCHKSVYNAVELLDLKMVHIYPEGPTASGINGEISAENVEKLIISESKAESPCENAGNIIKAVVITSPTYEGVVSDVRAIAGVCHHYGIPLIVDQAHGAHLNFMTGFGESAVKAGADIVIESLHKTLPALTQTALLHLPADAGRYLEREDGQSWLKGRVEKYLKVYQTSSPSYVFMASICRCIRVMEGERDSLKSYFERLERFRSSLQGLKNIQLFEPAAKSAGYDISKIVIETGSIPGKMVYDFARLKGLQPEMAAEGYVLFYSTLADTEEAFDVLFECLKQADSECFRYLPEASSISADNISVSIQAPGGSRHVTLKEALGEKSAAFICKYPPGTPIVAQGETFTEGAINEIVLALSQGLNVEGIEHA